MISIQLLPIYRLAGRFPSIFSKNGVYSLPICMEQPVLNGLSRPGLYLIIIEVIKFLYSWKLHCTPAFTSSQRENHTYFFDIFLSVKFCHETWPGIMPVCHKLLFLFAHLKNILHFHAPKYKRRHQPPPELPFILAAIAISGSRMKLIGSESGHHDLFLDPHQACSSTP